MGEATADPSPAHPRVRPYRDTDRAALRELCCDTAVAGGPVDPLFPDRDAYADFFTRYYTDFEPETAFVAEAGGRVIGYLIGSTRPGRFRRVQALLMLAATGPKVLWRLVTGRYDARARRFLAWLATRSWRETPGHPPRAAHFHFNVLPEYRNSGAALRLWRAFDRRLAERGVRRVYGQIQTGAGETWRSDRLFRRWGFEQIDRRRVTKLDHLPDEVTGGRVRYVTTFLRDGERRNDGARPERPAGGRRRWLLLAAVAVATALFASGVLGGLTWEAGTLRALDRIGPGLLAALAALMAGSWLAGSARIHLLARSLGHDLRFRESAVVAVSGEFGAVASPGGVGGAPLRLLALHRRGVPLPEGTAVVAADLALDAVAGALIVAATVLLVLLSPPTRELAARLAGGARIAPWIAAWAGGIVGLLVLAGLAVRVRMRRRRAEIADGRARPSGRIGGLVDRLRADLAALVRHRPRTLALGCGLSLGQILLRYSILPVVVVALGGAPPVLALYPLQGLIHLVAHLAVVPGGGGSAELGGGLVVALFLPVAAIAPAVLLWRLFTFHWNAFVRGTVFLGGLAVLDGARRSAGRTAPAADGGAAGQRRGPRATRR